MKSLHFEWDESKSRANKGKHGISFEEARTVFYDESARIIHDPDHSDVEDRFILLGLGYKLRILVVVHAYRQGGEVIRITSARKATKNEVSYYQRVHRMRKEYDFSKSAANPYVKRLKQQITIRLEKETIEYFKQLAEEIDIPYQKLINLYLRDCAEKELKPSLSWQA